MNANPAGIPPKINGVCFGIPSLGHTVSLGFLRSWTATIGLLHDRDIISSSIQLGGDCFIAKARNRLVSDFLRECPGYDNFFFLDDDIDWPAEKVIEFLERPEPVLAGAYPQKCESTNFPVTFAYNTDTGELIEKDGLVRALLIPAGFLRIKRWVLEKLAESPTRPFLDATLEGAHKSYFGIFEEGIGTQEAPDMPPFWWGEDYIFSRKCQVLGIDMWVDPYITFGHVGRKRWEDAVGNHMDVYRAKAREAMQSANAPPPNSVDIQKQNLQLAIEKVMP